MSNALGPRAGRLAAMMPDKAPIVDMPDHKRPAPVVPDPRIRSTVRFMQENLNCPLTVSGIAAGACLSTSRLWHLFKANGGQSPKQVLLRLRLKRAKELLSASDLPLKQVAALAGMKHVANLERGFRAEFGVTPGKFREQIRAGTRSVDDASSEQ
jgi:transcriptional regulator GlxA family with amidase domain